MLHLIVVRDPDDAVAYEKLLHRREKRSDDPSFNVESDHRRSSDVDSVCDDPVFEEDPYTQQRETIERGLRDERVALRRKPATERPSAEAPKNAPERSPTERRRRDGPVGPRGKSSSTTSPAKTRRSGQRSGDRAPLKILDNAPSGGVEVMSLPTRRSKKVSSQASVSRSPRSSSRCCSVRRSRRAVRPTLESIPENTRVTREFSKTVSLDTNKYSKNDEKIIYPVLTKERKPTTSFNTVSKTKNFHWTTLLSRKLRKKTTASF